MPGAPQQCCCCVPLACDPPDITSITVVISGIVSCGCTTLGGGSVSMQLNGSPNLTVTLTPGVDQTETGTHFIAVRKAISVYADEFDHNGVCSGSPDEHLQLMVYVTVNATDVTVHIVQYIVATFIDDTIRAFIGSSPLCTSTTVPNNFSIGDCGDDGGGDQNLGYDGTATVVISC